MSSYEIFDPKVNCPLHELSSADARVAYDWFVKNIPSRTSILGILLDEENIQLDNTLDSLVELHDYFYKSVASEAGNTSLSSFVFSLCNDCGIYLAEMVIDVFPSIQWKLCRGPKSDLSYQRPVIMGFKVKNKKYHIDYDYLLCQYAHRIIADKPQEVGLFKALYNSALDNCK